MADEGIGREDIAFLNDVEESSLRYSPLLFSRALLIVFSSSILSSPALGEPKILKLRLRDGADMEPAREWGRLREEEKEGEPIGEKEPLRSEKESDGDTGLDGARERVRPDVERENADGLSEY